MAQTKPRPALLTGRLADLARVLRHASHAHHTSTKENRTRAEVELYRAAVEFGDEFRRQQRRKH